MSTFITELGQPPAAGGSTPLRLAVKDAIDVAGVPTTVGSVVLAELAEQNGPPLADAACLAGARAAGVHIVGKANLHELCFGGTGVNPWFGTPVNPLDARRIPGGSSSGSAVAVATGAADVAFGTDSAGSIRNPSACCGTAGLKTTWGSLPLDGIWPLSPSMDTVGPMAVDVAGVARGMALLDPTFIPLTASEAGVSALRIGRLRVADTDPVIDRAVDDALAQAELAVGDIDIPDWDRASGWAISVLLGEALNSDAWLWADHRERLGADIQQRMEFAEQLPVGALEQARSRREPWRAALAAVFAQVDLIALPALPWFAPLLDEKETRVNHAAAPVNLAGHPAMSLPIPAVHPPGSPDAGLPASLQLIGPDGTEALLLAAAAHVEAAVDLRR